MRLDLRLPVFLPVFLLVAMSFTIGAAWSVEPELTDTHIITTRDRIPRFCNPADVTAISSGLWSEPLTWSSNSVPAANAKVLIPDGISVTYDVLSDTPIDCIEIADGGVLSWIDNQDTRLKLIHLQVLPGGELRIGDAQNPIANDKSAEIIIRDVPLDTDGQDPAQYGNGIHVFGLATLHGRELARTFLRFAAEASANATVLELEQAPSDWMMGDRLLIPDTRQIPFLKNHVFTSQAEEPEILSITESSVTLTQGLLYNHYGPRDADGNVSPTELAMLPHIGNLSRNIIIRSVDLAESTKNRYCLGSENLDATSECITRGHIMLLARADVDMRYAMLKDLGRTTVDALDNTTFDELDPNLVTHIGTNQIGRYSLHVHHLAGPVNLNNTGYQLHLVGNVIEGFLKWGMTVHNSHYGLIKDNIVYDGNGSAIATEDGNESFNVFERNFIVHTKAGDSEQIIESPGRAGVNVGRSLFGFTRDGFWFSGMNNYVRDNVVANAPGFSYNYNGYYLTPHQPVPDFRGADMAGNATIQTALPVLESVRNEAYGATGQGLWLTWSRGCCNVAHYQAISLFENFRIWHVNNAGVEAYHEARNSFHGFVLRNDSAVSAQSGGGSLRFNRGFHFANSSYENGQTVFRNLDVQGFNVGIQLPVRPEEGTTEPNITRLEDSFLKNYVNIQEVLPRIDAKGTHITNVMFEALDIGPIAGLPDTPTHIQMVYTVNKNTNFVDKHSATFVYDFNGVEENDFQVYFEEQAPDYPIPPPPDIDHPNFHVCPEANLTNLQCFTQHGVAIGGEVAPCIEVDGEANCSSARARAAALGIEGLVFPLDALPLLSDGFE